MAAPSLSEQLSAGLAAQRAAAAPATTGAPTATGAVDLSKLKAGSAAYYSGEDWNKFMTDYGPIIEKQMASLNSTAMVDRASKDATRVPDLMEGAVNRAAQRRGGITSTQFHGLAASREMNRATTTADLLNNARLDQRNRNTETAYKMSGLGTDVYQMGLDNVRESEGLATQRRINNATASQQAKSNVMGAAATIGSAALFALAM